LLAFSLSDWARAQDCSGQRTVVDRLRARVKADQSQIQRLNPTLTANELDRWANAAEQERQQILKKSLVSATSTLADRNVVSAGECFEADEPGGPPFASRNRIAWNRSGASLSVLS